jgi:anti-sigma factor RsiW
MEKNIVVDRMQLPVIDEALTAYINGELSLQVHIRIEEVLKHDPEAAARVELLRKLRKRARTNETS